MHSHADLVPLASFRDTRFAPLCSPLLPTHLRFPWVPPLTCAPSSSTLLFPLHLLTSHHPLAVYDRVRTAPETKNWALRVDNVKITKLLRGIFPKAAAKRLKSIEEGGLENRAAHTQRFHQTLTLVAVNFNELMFKMAADNFSTNPKSTRHVTLLHGDPRFDNLFFGADFDHDGSHDFEMSPRVGPTKPSEDPQQISPLVAPRVTTSTAALSTASTASSPSNYPAEPSGSTISAIPQSHCLGHREDSRVNLQPGIDRAQQVVSAHFKLIDFQGSREFPGEFDLAYFMAGSMTTDLRRKYQKELLNLYYARMRDCGVNMTLHHYLLEVQHGLLLPLILSTVATDAGDAKNSERGRLLMTTSRERNELTMLDWKFHECMEFWIEQYSTKELVSPTVEEARRILPKAFVEMLDGDRAVIMRRASEITGTSPALKGGARTTNGFYPASPQGSETKELELKESPQEPVIGSHEPGYAGASKTTASRSGGKSKNKVFPAP